MNTEDEQRRDYSKRTKREDAFLAIDGERKYQDQRWGARERELTHEIDLIVSFSHKLEDAIGKTEPREIIREIAALCVRAMEQHGVVSRAT